MWKPIIKEEFLLKEIKKKLNQIQSSLQTINEKNSSILSGQPGILLFKSYYSRFDPSKDISYKSNIQILFDYFQEPTSLNFSYGMSGILHTLSHLEKEGFIDFGDEIKKFDHSIFEPYIKNEKTLDYLHGNTGVALSLLEQNIETKYDYLFDRWLSAIEEIKEPDYRNLKWKTDFWNKENVVERGYCFGLAHGVPSIIIILLKLYKRNKSEKVLDYITRSITFLLENKLEDQSEFYFPTRIVNEIKVGSKLAWCYGDLGVALSLYLYGEYFKNSEISLFAIEIFTRHTTKRDCSVYHVEDADFCHGSIGIAHIYARIYNYTGIEIFRETSEYWYKVTIEKSIYTDGMAGYKHSHGKDKLLESKYGLLEGISGIGLSFISAICDIEPKWDNVFLLS